MNILIVLLGLIGVTLAAPGTFNRSIIKFHPTIGGRIVGGVEADISELEYQAALLRNGAQICGGSIISETAILTAAHCVEPHVITSISQLSFRVGSSQWRSGGQVVAAAEIIIHERYNPYELDCDIAVIKLADTINVSHAVPVSLPAAGKEFSDGTYGVVSGWGVTSSGSSQSPETLRKVSVPVANRNWCGLAYGGITGNMICAGYTAGGADACQGDSGGPYVIDGELVGVVSFGIGCALPLYPGVYTNVPAFIDWIKEKADLD